MKKVFLLLLINLFVISPDIISAQSVAQQKFQLGISYLQNGMYQEAEKILEELIKSEPNNKQFFSAYSELMKIESKYSQLLPIAETYYQNNKDLESTNLLAELYWRIGKVDNANELWNKAIKLDKESQVNYSVVAQTQTELKLFDKAITTYNLGRSAIDNNNLFSDQLIKLYITTNDYKNGFSEIIEALKNNMNIAIAQGRIYALMSNKEANDFLKLALKELSNNNPSALAYQELYAWFLRTTQRLNEALDIYIRLDELKKANGYEIINFATLSTQDGQFDIALKAYDILIAKGKSNPYYTTAIYGYTKALDDKLAFDTKNSDSKIYNEVIKRYHQIIDDFPKSNQAAESRLRIAAIYVDKLNDIGSAIDELQKLINDFPNSNQAILGALNLGKYYLIDSNISKAKLSFLSIANNRRIYNPNQADEANYYLALCDYYNGNIDTAKSQFKIIIKNTESNTANDALSKLNFLEENKTFVEPLNDYVKAEFLKYQRKYDDAYKNFIKVSDKSDNSSLGESALYQACMIKFDLKEFNDFRNCANNLIGKYPNTLRGDELSYYLAESFYLENNEPEALRLFIDLLTKYPESIYLNDARKKIRILRKEKV